MKNKGLNPPKIEITGENYEVGGINGVVASILGYVRLVCLAMLFAGESITSALFGENPPPVMRTINGWIKQEELQRNQ